MASRGAEHTNQALKIQHLVLEMIENYPENKEA